MTWLFKPLRWRTLGRVAIVVSMVLLLPTPSRADEWGEVAYISSTMGVTGGRLCAGEGSRGALGCPTYAPSLTTAGDISVTGNLSAAKFIGDGSGLTGIGAASISVTTGLSGSLVFRDEYGSLQARSSLSISSTTGSVGLGAGAPASVGNNGLYASGNIQSAANLAANNLSLNGGSQGVQWLGANGTSYVSVYGDKTSQYLTFNTSSTEALRIVSTGYVGIGTTTPTRTLDVSGSIGGSGVLALGESGGTATPRIIFRRSLDGGSNAYIGLQSSAGSEMRFSNNAGQSYYTWVTNDNSVTMERMRLSQSGSLGVGTTAPSTTLHVSGTLRIADGAEACDTNRLGAIKYASGAFYICQNTANGWEALGTTGSNANNDRIVSGTTQMITYNNSSATIATAGVERVVVGTNGEVGIAQQPVAGHGLDVSGSTYLNGILVTNKDAVIGANLTVNNHLTVGGNAILNNNRGIYWGTGTYIAGSGATAPSLTFIVSGTEALRIVSSGYVGIGTTAPSYTLEISNPSATLSLKGIDNNVRLLTPGGKSAIFAASDSSNNVFFGTVSNDPLVLRTGNVARMTIANSNNINIGANLFIGSSGNGTNASTSLHVSGTLRIADGAEACDTNRLGAIKYASGAFSICQNTTNGWEPLSTSTSSTTPSISSGLSGSIVFRDQSGYLKANNTFSISSTTGSVGIGAGAPANIGNDSLYAAGIIQAPNVWATARFRFNTSGNGTLEWLNSNNMINGDSTNKYIAFTTSGTEALRIVSTGYVGIGAANPTTKLEVAGRVSASTIQLADSPADTCGPGTYGTLKMIAGRPYVCRP
jgi:hypothetical protein